jgi:hypothetical protein
VNPVSKAGVELYSKAERNAKFKTEEKKEITATED